MRAANEVLMVVILNVGFWNVRKSKLLTFWLDLSIIQAEHFSKLAFGDQNLWQYCRDTCSLNSQKKKGKWAEKKIFGAIKKFFTQDIQWESIQYETALNKFSLSDNPEISFVLCRTK